MSWLCFKDAASWELTQSALSQLLRPLEPLQSAFLSISVSSLLLARLSCSPSSVTLGSTGRWQAPPRALNSTVLYTDFRLIPVCPVASYEVPSNLAGAYKKKGIFLRYGFFSLFLFQLCLLWINPHDMAARRRAVFQWPIVCQVICFGAWRGARADRRTRPGHVVHALP